jgi:uncharacterized protein
MASATIAFIAGLIFALGLAIAGMTKPENVIGFLDLTGTWRPALAFVMVGAIMVFGVTYRIIIKRPRPFFDLKFHLPDKTRIDRRLIGGAVLFGLGWGIAGYCPGPALTALGAGVSDTFIFVPALLAGMMASVFADRFL